MDHYKRLLAKYEQTTPYRGRKDDPVRPFERVKKVWVQNPKFEYGSDNGEPWGHYVEQGVKPRSSRYQMRLADDGALSILYHGTAALTLYTDGRVGLVCTSYGGDGYIHDYLPTGVRPVSSQGTLFISDVDKEVEWRGEGSKHVRVAHLGYRQVTLKPDSNGQWQVENPVDRWTIDVLDKAATRGVSRRYHLADFNNWFRAYDTLTDGRDVSSALDDHEAVCAALLERDFITAYHNLEPVQSKVWGWAPYSTYHSGSRSQNEPRVTRRSLERTRLRLYNEHGAVSQETHAVLPLALWRSRVQSKAYQAN